MNGSKTFSTTPAPMQVPAIVRDLCDSIDAAMRGDISRAGAEIRRAVTLSAKLLSTGAIDSRGASLIKIAAAKAEQVRRAMRLVAHAPVAAQAFVESQSRIKFIPTIELPQDQLQSFEDARFDPLLDLLTGGEWADLENKMSSEYRGEDFYVKKTATAGALRTPVKR